METPPKSPGSKRHNTKKQKDTKEAEATKIIAEVFEPDPPSINLTDTSYISRRGRKHRLRAGKEDDQESIKSSESAGSSILLGDGMDGVSRTKLFFPEERDDAYLIAHEQSYIDGRRAWNDDPLAQSRYLVVHEASDQQRTYEGTVRRNDCRSALLNTSYVSKRKYSLRNNRAREENALIDSLPVVESQSHEGICHGMQILGQSERDFGHLTESFEQENTKNIDRSSCFLKLPSYNANSISPHPKKHSTYMVMPGVPNSNFLHSIRLRAKPSESLEEKPSMSCSDTSHNESNFSNNYLLRKRVNSTESEGFSNQRPGGIVEASSKNYEVRSSPSHLGKRALSLYQKDVRAIAEQFENYPKSPGEKSDLCRGYDQLYLRRSKNPWERENVNGVDVDAKNGHLLKLASHNGASCVIEGDEIDSDENEHSNGSAKNYTNLQHLLAKNSDNENGRIDDCENSTAIRFLNDRERLRDWQKNCLCDQNPNKCEYGVDHDSTKNKELEDVIPDRYRTTGIRLKKFAKKKQRPPKEKRLDHSAHEDEESPSLQSDLTVENLRQATDPNHDYAQVACLFRRINSWMKKDLTTLVANKFENDCSHALNPDIDERDFISSPKESRRSRSLDDRCHYQTQNASFERNENYLSSNESLTKKGKKKRSKGKVRVASEELSGDLNEIIELRLKSSKKKRDDLERTSYNENDKALSDSEKKIRKHGKKKIDVMDNEANQKLEKKENGNKMKKNKKRRKIIVPNVLVIGALPFLDRNSKTNGSSHNDTKMADFELDTKHIAKEAVREASRKRSEAVSRIVKQREREIRDRGCKKEGAKKKKENSASAAYDSQRYLTETLAFEAEGLYYGSPQTKLVFRKRSGRSQSPQSENLYYKEKNDKAFVKGGTGRKSPPTKSADDWHADYNAYKAWRERYNEVNTELVKVNVKREEDYKAFGKSQGKTRLPLVQDALLEKDADLNRITGANQRKKSPKISRSKKLKESKSDILSSSQSSIGSDSTVSTKTEEKIVKRRKLKPKKITIVKSNPTLKKTSSLTSVNSEKSNASTKSTKSRERMKKSCREKKKSTRKTKKIKPSSMSDIKDKKSGDFDEPRCKMRSKGSLSQRPKTRNDKHSHGDSENDNDDKDDDDNEVVFNSQESSSRFEKNKDRTHSQSKNADKLREKKRKYFEDYSHRDRSPKVKTVSYDRNVKGNDLHCPRNIMNVREIRKPEVCRKNHSLESKQSFHDKNSELTTNFTNLFIALDKVQEQLAYNSLIMKKQNKECKKIQRKRRSESEEEKEKSEKIPAKRSATKYIQPLIEPHVDVRLRKMEEADNWYPVTKSRQHIINILASKFGQKKNKESSRNSPDNGQDTETFNPINKQELKTNGKRRNNSGASSPRTRQSRRRSPYSNNVVEYCPVQEDTISFTTLANEGNNPRLSKSCSEMELSSCSMGGVNNFLPPFEECGPNDYRKEKSKSGDKSFGNHEEEEASNELKNTNYTWRSTSKANSCSTKSIGRTKSSKEPDEIKRKESSFERYLKSRNNNTKNTAQKDEYKWQCTIPYNLKTLNPFVKRIVEKREMLKPKNKSISSLKQTKEKSTDNLSSRKNLQNPTKSFSSPTHSSFLRSQSTKSSNYLKEISKSFITLLNSRIRDQVGKGETAVPGSTDDQEPKIVISLKPDNRLLISTVIDSKTSPKVTPKRKKRKTTKRSASLSPVIDRYGKLVYKNLTKPKKKSMKNSKKTQTIRIPTVLIEPETEIARRRIRSQGMFEDFIQGTPPFDVEACSSTLINQGHGLFQSWREDVTKVTDVETSTDQNGRETLETKELDGPVILSPPYFPDKVAPTVSYGSAFTNDKSPSYYLGVNRSSQPQQVFDTDLDDRIVSGFANGCGDVIPSTAGSLAETRRERIDCLPGLQLDTVDGNDDEERKGSYEEFIDPGEFSIGRDEDEEYDADSLIERGDFEVENVYEGNVDGGVVQEGDDDDFVDDYDEDEEYTVKTLGGTVGNLRRSVINVTHIVNNTLEFGCDDDDDEQDDEYDDGDDNRNGGGYDERCDDENKDDEDDLDEGGIGNIGYIEYDYDDEEEKEEEGEEEEGKGVEKEEGDGEEGGEEQEVEEEEEQQQQQYEEELEEEEEEEGNEEEGEEDVSEKAIDVDGNVDEDDDDKTEVADENGVNKVNDDDSNDSDECEEDEHNNIAEYILENLALKKIVRFVDSRDNDEDDDEDNDDDNDDDDDDGGDDDDDDDEEDDDEDDDGEDDDDENDDEDVDENDDEKDDEDNDEDDDDDDDDNEDEDVNEKESDDSEEDCHYAEEDNEENEEDGDEEEKCMTNNNNDVGHPNKFVNCSSDQEDKWQSKEVAAYNNDEWLTVNNVVDNDENTMENRCVAVCNMGNPLHESFNDDDSVDECNNHHCQATESYCKDDSSDDCSDDGSSESDDNISDDNNNSSHHKSDQSSIDCSKNDNDDGENAIDDDKEEENWQKEGEEEDEEEELKKERDHDTCRSE